MTISSDVVLGFVGGALGALTMQWLVARWNQRRLRRRWLAHGPLELP